MQPCLLSVQVISKIVYPVLRLHQGVDGLKDSQLLELRPTIDDVSCRASPKQQSVEQGSIAEGWQILSWLPPFETWALWCLLLFPGVQYISLCSTRYNALLLTPTAASPAGMTMACYSHVHLSLSEQTSQVDPFQHHFNLILSFAASPSISRVAAIANMYKKGISHLLCL